MNDLKVHVIELVRDVVREYSTTENPCLDEISVGLGLEVKEAALPAGIDGMLEGTRILINSRAQREERKRFTHAHEVTHHLLNEDGGLLSHLHDLTYNQKGEYKRQLERFCNMGAAELLMPSQEFTKLYKERGFNVELILLAAEYFKSSTIAATIQLAQVAPNKCIAVVCENGLIPNGKISGQDSLFPVKNQSDNKPKLHVIYSAVSPATNRWLAKWTTFPDGHLINQAFLQDRRLDSESEIPFPDWQEPCICEALPYKNRVYALFHLSPPPAPNQMTLF